MNDLSSSLDRETRDETNLRRFVEQVTGGRVVEIVRQPRRRRSGWSATVDCEAGPLRLQLRGAPAGEAGADELREDAEMLRMLKSRGLDVPRVYGVCDDPVVLVADCVNRPGSRAGFDKGFAEHLARLHAEPLQRNRGRTGAPVENGGSRSLKAVLPPWEGHEGKPQPLIEFALGWLRRNSSRSDEREAVLHCHVGGLPLTTDGLAELHDVAQGMVADPLCDLAILRLCAAVEPPETGFQAFCRAYEEAAGRDVDRGALSVHSVAAALAGLMSTAAAVANPPPGTDHARTLRSHLVLRHMLIAALGEAMALDAMPGEMEEVEVQPVTRSGANGGLIAMVSDMVARQEPQDEAQARHKAATAQLVEYLSHADAIGTDLRERDLEDVSLLMGKPFDDWAAAETDLVRYIHAAGPELDRSLLRLFAAQHAREMMLFGETEIGRLAAAVRLPASH